MKILIVRHGEPDYEIDGLTEKGAKEAELLADRLTKENIRAVYCSTLGRARLTAKPTLDRLGITAEYCEWLREFDYATIKVPYRERPKNAWDVLPEYINTLDGIYEHKLWSEEDFVKNSDLKECYDAVCREFDALLSKYGYERHRHNYKAKTPNHDTIVIVCHFGLMSVLLSHLMNCSPYSIWQHICAAPTSVTTIYTEERCEGEALFRIGSIGDTSHLYKADEPISFAARFCECYTDDTRH